MESYPPPLLLPPPPRYFLQAGLVWYYAAKDVPFLISVGVFTSWLLGFVGTLLLPADIVLTLLNGVHRCAAGWFGVSQCFLRLAVVVFVKFLSLMSIVVATIRDV